MSITSASARFAAGQGHGCTSAEPSDALSGAPASTEATPFHRRPDDCLLELAKLDSLFTLAKARSADFSEADQATLGYLLDARHLGEPDYPRKLTSWSAALGEMDEQWATDLPQQVAAARQFIQQALECARRGDATALELVVALANGSSTLGSLAQSAKEVLFELHRAGAPAADALIAFAEHHLPDVARSHPTAQGFLLDADMAYLAGLYAKDRHEQLARQTPLAQASSQQLHERLAAWILETRATCFDEAPANASASSAPKSASQRVFDSGRFVDQEEITGALAACAADRGSFVFVDLGAADTDITSLNIPDNTSQMARICAALQDAATEAGKPAATPLFREKHWVLLLAAPRTSGASASAARHDFLVFDSNVRNKKSSVGLTLSEGVARAGFNAHFVPGNMQKEAPNGCAPLCLVAMEHAFPALDEDAQPVGLSAVADRMSDFVHQFNGQVDKPSRQWLVQVARAQLLQAAAPEEGLPWEGEAFIGR